jgi:hypothetical protein
VVTRGRCVGHRGDRRPGHVVRPHRRNGRRGPLPGPRPARGQLPDLGAGVRTRRFGAGSGGTRAAARPERLRRPGRGDSSPRISGCVLVRDAGASHGGGGGRLRRWAQRVPDLGEEHGLRRLPPDGQRGNADPAGLAGRRRVF